MSIYTLDLTLTIINYIFRKFQQSNEMEDSDESEDEQVNESINFLEALIDK